MADLLAHVLAFDGGLGLALGDLRGHYTASGGTFNYREGRCCRCETGRAAGIDLAPPTRYSDSESDLPMLRARPSRGGREPRPTCGASPSRRAGRWSTSTVSGAA